MKRVIAVIAALCLVLSCLAGCGTSEKAGSAAGNGKVEFTDSAGRTVEVPEDITKVAASGAVAQMILYTLDPDLLVGLASPPGEDQVDYFPDSMKDLPVFGQFYGKKANLNMEALIAAEPQIIIDLGDQKEGIGEDMDMIQKQTGIPTVYINAEMDQMADAYRTLGGLLGREEQAEKLASYVDDTLKYAKDKSAAIEADKVKTVMYGTSSTGLACNAEGSSQASVIDMIGAENAIKTTEVTDKGGGTIVDLEKVYEFDPDVIILDDDGPFSTLSQGEWSDLKAVKNGEYYEIPDKPYSWMAAPPSINRILGIWWLGNLVYPDVYNDYDVADKAKEYYSLFWHYELSDKEVADMLANSTNKEGRAA